MRRIQHVIFQRPEDVGRGRPQGVGRELPWRYIEDYQGTSIGRLLGTYSGPPRDVILPCENILIDFTRSYLVEQNQILLITLTD